ncbi:MAG TPA: hypothetical protein VF940_09910 [Streptosporangiaceae bacterium]
MTRRPDAFHDSGIAAQAESIRATARRFDEVTLTAAEDIRNAENRFLEGTLSQADADAVLEAANAAVPYAASLVRLLAALEVVPVSMQRALRELLTDSNIARITDVLRFIETELNSYFADADSVHLTNALDTGRQSLYQALRRSFGY